MRGYEGGHVRGHEGVTCVVTAWSRGTRGPRDLGCSSVVTWVSEMSRRRVRGHVDLSEVTREVTHISRRKLLGLERADGSLVGAYATSVPDSA